MNQEKLLSDLIGYNTVNDLENYKIINYIEDYLKKLGFKTEYKSKCLVMSIGSSPILSFIGHTDVVPVNNNNWGTNPFELKITNDKYIGRGSSDMKGGICAFLIALSKIDLNKLKRGIRVCFTYDEEIGFKGIKELLDRKIDFCKYTIIGEPTDNYPCIGSKGLLEYELTFKGKAVHSSKPIPNESSNENAILFLNDILKLNEKFKQEKCSLFEVPYNTINIGTINGGTNICTTPSLTKVLLGFRITKNKEDIKYIKEYIDSLTKKYKNVSYKILNEINPFYNDNDITLEYEKITNKKRKPFFAVSEASFLDNNRLILGPGPITCHEDNEYILKKSLEDTINNYMRIIERICK